MLTRDKQQAPLHHRGWCKLTARHSQGNPAVHTQAQFHTHLHPCTQQAVLHGERCPTRLWPWELTSVATHHVLRWRHMSVLASVLTVTAAGPAGAECRALSFPTFLVSSGVMRKLGCTKIKTSPAWHRPPTPSSPAPIPGVERGEHRE